jgi:putative aldouronate transport system substrate-binding protein
MTRKSIFIGMAVGCALAASAAAFGAPADPFGTDTPAIEVSAVRAEDASLNFRTGESATDNAWTRGYLQDLGIKLRFLWTAQDYDEKLSMMIAANDLPDIFQIRDINQFRLVAESGALADLTSAYKEYASDVTRRQTEMDPIDLSLARVEGRLYGLPWDSNPKENATVVWVRSDWMKKLRLGEPKSMKDLLAMAEAFATRDPDGNGKNDTYGLAMHSGLYDGTPAASLQGFFEGYHAYPMGWIARNGKLVYGSIQPQMKDALKSLQVLFAKGFIDKEFVVKDLDQVVESDLTTGKAGIAYGAWWNPNWPLVFGVKAIEGLDWVSYPLPSIDGSPAKPLVKPLINAVWVVSRSCKHPEAMIKLTNYFWKRYWTTDEATYGKFITETVGDKVVDTQRVAFPEYFDLAQNPAMARNVTAAIKTKNTSKLTLEQRQYYTGITDYLKTGNKDYWAWARSYYLDGPGSYRILLDYFTGARPIEQHMYLGPTTSLMAEKVPLLKKRELEVMTKIITGDSLDSFDTFVSDWRKLGGDEMTREVNDWYAKNKK